MSLTWREGETGEEREEGAGVGIGVQEGADPEARERGKKESGEEEKTEVEGIDVAQVIDA